MPSVIEQVEAYAVATRIDVRAEIGDTKLTLRAPLEMITGEESMQFRINPGEATEEDATVSSVAGREVTLSSGLTYAHNAGELVIRLIYTSLIANDAIDGDKIADDSIDSEHYVDGSIDTAHLAIDAIATNTSKTISSGVITLSLSNPIQFVLVDTEGGAATDDLVTINPGTIPTGSIIYIRATNDDHTVVVKDGTGNLRLNSDHTLDTVQKTLALFYIGSNIWQQIPTSLGDNGITADMVANRTRTFIVQPHEDTGPYWLLTGATMTDNTDTFIHGYFIVPKDFVSGMTIEAVVTCPSSGNIKGTLIAYYAGENEAWNLHSNSTPATVALGANQREVINSVSLASAAVDDFVSLRYSRYGGDEYDTLNTDAYFFGFLVTYTADS